MLPQSPAEVIVIDSDSECDEQEGDSSGDETRIGDESIVIVDMEVEKQNAPEQAPKVVDEDLIITFSQPTNVPHARYDCPVYPFQPTNEKKVPINSNVLVCEQCYCYICDKPASQCEMWTVTEACHCNSHKRNVYWRGLRDTKPDIVKDWLVKPLRDQHVKPKNKATFTAELYEDTPNYKWYKNNDELAPSDKVEMQKDGKNLSLTINNCQPDDVAEYTVVVEDARYSVKLTLGGAPKRKAKSKKAKEVKSHSDSDSSSEAHRLAAMDHQRVMAMKEEYKVPESLVGLVIGRNGEQIKRIQLESGCNILFAEYRRGLMERPCSLTGTREQIEQAKRMLASVQEMLIPASKVGLLIGKGGDTINRLQAARELVIGEKDQGDFRTRQNDFTARLGGSTLNVAVPRFAVGIVIGQNGDMIKKIQDDTGVRIQFKPDDGIRWRVAMVMGHPDRCRHAVHLINNLIQTAQERAGLGSTMRGGGGRVKSCSDGTLQEVSYTIPADKCGPVSKKGLDQITAEQASHCTPSRKRKAACSAREHHGAEDEDHLPTITPGAPKRKAKSKKAKEVKSHGDSDSSSEGAPKRKAKSKKAKEVESHGDSGSSSEGAPKRKAKSKKAKEVKSHGDSDSSSEDVPVAATKRKNVVWNVETCPVKKAKAEGKTGMTRPSSQVEEGGLEKEQRDKSQKKPQNKPTWCKVCDVWIPFGNEDEHNQGRQHQQKLNNAA